ncbi:dormancy-associated protein homolog 4-like [Eutrema salsugineum]|uniref:dormancy-associated protein homolog 4-like n=1 Tax=Eutrema salsugineum TaxID=72664 RepID=UPI000CED0B56|nr:dormancy-associated protein homolog 4-like [Eutrema salsugineum]
MGFLHKLWDETVAGPAPENCLGKLKNHIPDDSVTRNGHQKLMVNPGRVSESPVGSINPGSPLTPGTPSETHAASLNACDWIVLNALDR